MARRLLVCVGGAAIAASAAWSFWPLGQPELQSELDSNHSTPTSARGTSSAAFSVAPFSATLWHEPPAPVVSIPPKPPEMPKLELVGIAGSGDNRRAIVQDNDSGELRTVSAGDSFGVTTVLGVDADRVRCEAHGTRFELRLDGGAP